ncbi:MAG: G5 domain-containing protein, partial [Chloroflexi bacterium]|nr:G5 domain-containing protein [Chloroflexota bacterium]
MRVSGINKLLLLGLSLISVFILTSCRDGSSQSDDFTITVEVDGDRLVYRYDKRQSVGQFLQEIGVTLGEFDEVNPLLQTQVRDGMRITVTRVMQYNDCSATEVLPFTTERQAYQNLQPGETRVIQTGENGEVQVCYRITEKDGIQTERVEISRVPIKAARNEIIAFGSEPMGTLIPTEGVLTYVSSGQAFVIQGNTANLNPLTENGFLDGRVFDLSADGKQLLYTRRTADETDPQFSNELWAVLDTSASFPRQVQLLPEDVRTAQWVAGDRGYMVSYSTANPDGSGWRAYNDLYLMQLDPETGEALPDEFEELISSNSLGSYAYWGRRFVWSPTGTQLAWANADSIGLVDLEKGEFITLMNFREYAPLLELYQGATVWIPTLSWS